MVFQKEKKERLCNLAKKKKAFTELDLYNCGLSSEDIQDYLRQGLLKCEGTTYVYTKTNTQNTNLPKNRDFYKDALDAAKKKDYGTLRKLYSSKSDKTREDRINIDLLLLLMNLKAEESGVVPKVKSTYSTSPLQAIQKCDYYYALTLLKAEEELSKAKQIMVILLEAVVAEIVKAEIRFPKSVETSLDEEKSILVSHEVLAAILSLITTEGVMIEVACQQFGLSIAQTSLVKLILAKELLRNRRLSVAEELLDEVRACNHRETTILSFIDDIEGNIKNMKANPKQSYSPLDATFKRVPKDRIVKPSKKEK